MDFKNRKALAALEAKVRAILPEDYQDSYDDIQPVSMGTASLKYGSDGKVVWDEIWESFCDLAMAGGPPHKGKLLEPGSRDEILAQSDRYGQVVEEICRGVLLVAELEAKPSPIPGWVRVECESDGMAGWLTRAIVMENVSARCEGKVLNLPAGPGYRIEKEIKNVITVVAKTCHYWIDHMWLAQQQEISKLFAAMGKESPLIQPLFGEYGLRADEYEILRSKMAAALLNATGLRMSHHHYGGWLGVECPDVRSAIWMMRAMVVSNCLARREETVLFVPFNPESDPGGERVVRSLVNVHGFARARNIL